LSNVICQTSCLSKKYKDTYALQDINFQIKKGEIYGLIGENGAGKTTLMKLLTGIIFATDGEIEIFGERGYNNLVRKRNKIGCTIENPAIYGDLTARQNLEIHRLEKGVQSKNCVEEVLSLVKLTNDSKKKAKHYSLGMKQRLAIAMALLGDPELLILDEPVNGLDPTGIIELRELLVSLNKEKGITIMISSHILSELHKLATCYGIIHGGKLVEQITAAELDEKCRKHIYIQVDDVQSAVQILETKLNIQDYSVFDNNVIKVYSHIDERSKVNRTLAQNNIFANDFTVRGDSLEAYFSRAIGGKQYA